MHFLRHTCACTSNFRQVLFLVIKVQHVTEVYSARSLYPRGRDKVWGDFLPNMWLVMGQ